MAEGATCLPAQGMGAIPWQIADRLAPGAVLTGTRVETASPTGVVLAGGRRLEVVVRHQLEEWFGRDIRGLRRRRTYRIPHALPDQAPRNGRRTAATTVGGVYVCGNGDATASIQGAMVSGRVVADAVNAALAQ